MGRKQKGAAIVAGSLLAAGCTPIPPTATTTAIARSTIGSPAGVTAALARDGVYHDHFVRRTLYTWTTHEQIEELGKTRQLLVRQDSPTHGASYFEQVLYALVRRGDPLATVLYTSSYAKMRFAWHNPWATRRGWPGESYGNELIRVTLRPDAIVLGLSTARATFEARDLQDREVSLADVLAHPERIGAVYFVSDAEAAAPGLPPPKASYREYALCNESMIESWSIGDAELWHVLATEAAALDELAGYLRSKPVAAALAPAVVWPTRGPDAIQNPERAFVAALAFVNGWYALELDAIATLAAALRDTPRPAALTVAVRSAFPGAGVPRKPPVVVAAPPGSPSSTFARGRKGTY